MKRTTPAKSAASNSALNETIPFSLWAAILLAIFVLLLYARLLFTNRVLASGDILHYFYPYRDFAAAAARGGNVPFWNPYIFLGVPFLANPQAAVLYPFHWPLSWLPVTKQIYWSAAFHTWLLGFGGYWLARRWAHDGWPALTAGIVLAGSGFYGGLIGHINQMNAAAWLPWLLLLIDAPSPHPRNIARYIIRQSTLLGILVAFMLLAGHTQTAYINLFAAGIWTLVPLVNVWSGQEWRVRWSDTGIRLAIYAAGVTLGILLSGAQLLPTLEVSELGLRSGGLSYLDATSFSLKPLHLHWTLLPTYGLVDLSVVFGTLGYTEFVAYVGLIALPLAALGLWRGDARLRLIGLLFAGAGIFLAAGRWNPIYYLLYKFAPGFDLFRAPARWMMLYTLGMALLASAGLLAIRRPRLRVLLTLLIGVELLLAARALPHTQPTAPQAVYDVRTAPAHLLTDPLRTALSPAAAGRFLSMSTITFDPGDMIDFRRIFLEGESPQLEPQAFDQLIVALKSQEILAPNLALLWRIPGVDGFDGGVLPLQRYIDLLTLFVPPEDVVPDGRLREQVERVPDADLLSLLNVQYVITDKVRDLWFEDVYYDRQVGARLSPEGLQAVTVDVPQEFEATHIGIIGFIDSSLIAGERDVLAPFAQEARPVAEVRVVTDDATPRTEESFTLTAGGEPGAHLADGALDSLMAQSAGASVAYQDVEGGRQEYLAELALPAPIAPHALTVTLLDTPVDVVIQAVTLIDERTGMFYALLPSDRGRFRRVHSGDVKVYENLDVLPRAYLVQQAIWVERPEDALAAVRDRNVDPSQAAVIEVQNRDILSLSLPQPGAQPSASQPGQVEIVAYAPEEVVVEVVNDAPGLLVLSDTHYPDWHATVDDIPSPIFATNYFFRGVEVPTGEHTVVFRYQPQSWRRGLWVSGIGVVLLVLGVFYGWRRVT